MCITSLYNLFSDFFSKNVTFTKFLLKMSETKLQQFPHCESVGLSYFDHECPFGPPIPFGIFRENKLNCN